MIATQGGITGGYGLYVRDGRPVFVYPYLSLERIAIESKERLPAGKVQLKVDFAYQGSAKEVGKAATVTLSVNGKAVANGQLSKTIPATLRTRRRLRCRRGIDKVTFDFKPPN